MLRNLIGALVGLAIMGMTGSANAELIVDGSGQLLGATAVDVNGTLYDVAFADGFALVPAGSWGGEHIRLLVTNEGATVEFDCATAMITERLAFDEKGHFLARGIYAAERGGPRHPGESQRPAHMARFDGWTDGKDMRLAVTLSLTGRQIGSFSLRLGQRPRLEKCL